MAITKIITPGAQNFHEPVTQQIKISRHGLHGTDLDAFVKRASVQFIDKMSSMRFQPGEVPVHLLAVGATEAYGPNRNGDGFRERTCQDRHHTFQKFARWYRDHQNKDESKGRGIIKASAYNGNMRRIELLVALNGTQEAADRNGGLVADEELEKLARNEDIPVSMACRVSHDVCSSCGNKAKTRKEYCGPETCKYGGCRDNLGKTFDDGHTLHVDNPDPSFFDISQVFRPADRIAYTLGQAKVAADYQGMMKAASEQYGENRSSAALAEKLGVTPPLWLLADSPWADPRLVGQLKIASQLIQREAAIAGTGPNPQDRAFHASVRPPRDDCPDLREGPFKLAHVVTALAAEKCMLPVDSFVAMLTGGYTAKTAQAADCVADRLPGVFTRLATSPQLEEDLRTNPYVPGGPAPRRISHWVLKHAAEWSLDRNRVIERLQTAVLRSPAAPAPRREAVKTASSDSTEDLAKQYALYQLGFLHACQKDADADFLQDMAIRSNFAK